MTDSNRVRVAAIKEATLGTTPATPRMRTLRDIGEGLNWTPQFYTSVERRADRMRTAPSKINDNNDGSINFEMSYPAALGAASAMIESAMLSAWVSTPERDNDGTADSVITDVAATGGGTVTITTGAAFTIGHLVLQSGFSVAANNGVFKVTTGGTLSYICSAASMSAEAAPPATARVKVVGVEGASADIVATATGLTSTTMNFVTMGIAVGQWLKIGGTAAGTKFATAANTGWARVTAVSANAITLDNRPVGWTSDAGTGKTIRIFFGDYIRNGTTLQGLTFERGFLAQAVPTYIVQRGMCVDTLDASFADGDAIKGSFSFQGMSGSESTTALSGATYASAPTNTVMTSNASVGDIRINGSSAGTPNWVKNLTVRSQNNLRAKTATGNVGAVDVGVGSHLPTGTVAAYFGSDALLAQAMAGTPGSIAVRAQINSQSVIMYVPQATFTNHSANADGIDSDVMQNLEWQGSVDTLTNCQLQFDRLEYYE